MVVVVVLRMSTGLDLVLKSPPRAAIRKRSIATPPGLHHGNLAPQKIICY